ncbi:MAG: exonuclease SbcCD subunit D [Clostridia bacterium]
MRFLHLSDLHLGKRLYQFSLIEDQRFMLERVLDILAATRADALILAGDLYDRPVPPVEAVLLLDWFLTKVAQRNLPCLIVSGNHDSAERLGFAAQLLGQKGVYIGAALACPLVPVVLRDEFGPINCYLLPFVRPADARRLLPDQPIDCYDDAVRAVLGACAVDPDARNLLVAHQFVTGAGRAPERSESESISVGGIDNVDASCFADFDYVALGHLHRAQSVARPSVRYAGAPLAYAFSEAEHPASASVVDLGEKGCVAVDTVPISPLRALRTLRGPLRAILDNAPDDARARDDYLDITLTDEDELVDAIGRLRGVYKNLMHLSFDNARTRAARSLTSAPIARRDPVALFRAFYEMQNGRPLNDAQDELVRALLEEELP